MNQFDKIVRNAYIPKAYGYGFYFENYIFKDIDLDNKKILDLGGGNGIASIFALHKSTSCSSWIVDPITEGSNQLMLEQFNALKNQVDASRINYHRSFIDTLESPQEFDILIMHNSINHIGEDIIEEVLIDDKKYQEYVKRIKVITDRIKKNGILIVADCGRRNLWGDLGIKSPVAPSIEYNLHCEPNIWQNMIEETGSLHITTKRTARRELGILGKKVLANKLCSYMLDSHFVSLYRKI